MAATLRNLFLGGGGSTCHFRSKLPTVATRGLSSSNVRLSFGAGSGEDISYPLKDPSWVIGNEKWNKKQNVIAAKSGHFWPSYNERVHSPIKNADSVPDYRGNAYVMHMHANLKLNYWRAWYCASFIRGMSIDEALLQLSYIDRKPAVLIKRVLEEAQEMAVRDHNVEFKSNLWVQESFVEKGDCIKGFRRHGKLRMGVITYSFVNYCVALEEGRPPPKDQYYVKKRPKSSQQWIEEWLTEHRSKNIPKH